jgi:hypothetical protein
MLINSARKDSTKKMGELLPTHSNYRNEKIAVISHFTPWAY